MSGLVVFRSLRAALDAGYHIYGRTGDGYLARMRTGAGWALALVECSGTTGNMEQNKDNHAKEDQAKDDASRDEREADYDKTVADSFPASDPPAQP